MEGKPRAQLIRMLNSLRQPTTHAMLLEQFGGEQDTWISRLLEQLSEARLIVAANDRGESAKRYWLHFGDGGPEQGTSVETSYRVSVVGNGSPVRLAAFVLQEDGMAVGHVTWNSAPEMPGEGAAVPEAELPTEPGVSAEVGGDLPTGLNVMVVAWEQPDLSRVLSANRAAITRRIPCLFVDLSHGQHATLGPFHIQITIDLEHLAFHDEPVWRIPWCAACGDPPRQPASDRLPPC